MDKGRANERTKKGKTFRREIFYVESYEKYQCEERREGGKGGNWECFWRRNFNFEATFKPLALMKEVQYRPLNMSVQKKENCILSLRGAD